MSPEELRDFLMSRGVTCRVQKDEVKVQNCLFCGNPKWNLELNPGKAAYKCWSCSAKGFLGFLLERHFGIRVQFDASRTRVEKVHLVQSEDDLALLPMLNVPSAFAYLKLRRGMDPYRLLPYNLGVCGNPTHPMFGRLIIPVMEFWSQESAGFVARGYMGERPPYLADCTDDIVGYRVREKNAPYVLVEGPFDMLVAHLARCNVGGLLGRSSAADQVEGWVSRVPQDSPVVILMDGDAEEQSLSLWWRAVSIRPDVVRVQLPSDLDPGSLEPEVLGMYVRAHVAAA